MHDYEGHECTTRRIGEGILPLREADERAVWKRVEEVMEPIQEALETLTVLSDSLVDFPNIKLSWSPSGESHSPDADVIQQFEDWLQREELSRELDGMAAAAMHESFRVGFESAFSRRILEFLSSHGVPAVKEVRRKIIGGAFSLPVAEEAVRWLGLSQDCITHGARLSFLSEMIHSEFYALRDAALVALSDMDDPTVIPVLKDALNDAKPEEFRQDIISVLKQLEDAIAASPEDDQEK